jgi:hypothetical protein
MALEAQMEVWSTVLDDRTFAGKLEEKRVQRGENADVSPCGVEAKTNGTFVIKPTSG